MIPKICLFALASVLINILLDRMGFKSKALVTTLAAVLMLIPLSEDLGGLFGDLISLADKAGITDAATCAIKAVGLGYVFGFTAEVCSSLGEPLVSSVVTLAGRLQIFLLAYPYFEKIVKLGADLLE